MKKIFLVAFVAFGANLALAQSTTTSDNLPTNATKTGHKLENTTGTVYIPAKDADGSEKHDSIAARDTLSYPADKSKKRSRTKPKTYTGEPK